MNESFPTGITGHTAQGPDPALEGSPTRKHTTYEELRNKSREASEITLIPQTDPSVGPVQERGPTK